MSLYEFGPFQLDAERLLLLDRGEPLPLGPKVVETLLALVEHPGEVLQKSELLNRIWPEGYVDEANLAQNVYVLRKTLRRRWNFEAIETIPRRGYRFNASVSRREPLRPEPKVVPTAQPFVRRRARGLGSGLWPRASGRVGLDVPGSDIGRIDRRSGTEYAALRYRPLLLESAHP